MGIDLSARLASIAEQNARIIGARFPARAPTEIQIGDAAAFDVPNTPLLVHLYHPFQTDVTARVLQSLQHSHEREPRRIAVAHLLYTKVG